MGCELCCRDSQVDEPVQEKKKVEPPKEKEDPLKFNGNMARLLIKNLLADDNLYKQFLFPVMLFDDEQLENFFQGNVDYNNYPYYKIIPEKDKEAFKKLLYRFEDFSNILFEWYKDESKHNNIIKLWRTDNSIYLMKDYSDEKLEKELREAGLSDVKSFMEDFRLVMNSAIESKASDIKNYLKDEYEDFYSLITTSEDFKNDTYLSKPENNGVFEINFKNIIERLVKSSLPLVKNYATKKLLKLNNLSKLQFKSGMLNKLKNLVIDQFSSGGSSKNVGMSDITSLIGKLRNGSGMVSILKDLQAHFNNPNVAISHLVTSFMNLAISVKTYYDNSVEFDQKTKKYSDEMKSINQDFEYHKSQIGLLNLDNFEESLERIKTIGREIYKDKMKIIKFVKKIEEEEEYTKKEKKSTGTKKIIASAAGIVGSAFLCIVTGGAAAVAFGAAAAVSGVTMGVNIANFMKIKDQLKKYKNFKEVENKKYDEVESALAELQFKYNKIQRRYIPKNVLNNSD